MAERAGGRKNETHREPQVGTTGKRGLNQVTRPRDHPLITRYARPAGRDGTSFAQKGLRFSLTGRPSA